MASLRRGKVIGTSEVSVGCKWMTNYCQRVLGRVSRGYIGRLGHRNPCFKRPSSIYVIIWSLGYFLFHFNPNDPTNRKPGSYCSQLSLKAPEEDDKDIQQATASPMLERLAFMLQ